MTDRREAITALITGATLVAVPLRSSLSASATEQLELDAIWSGLRMAVVRLESRRDGATLDCRMTIESRGLAAFVTDWSGRMESSSRDLVPQRFRVRNESRRYTRDIAIDYDTDGRITRLDIKKRDEPQKLPFAYELTKGTIDPLTAIARLRGWAATTNPASTVERIFDGRARYDLRAEILPGDAGRRRVKLAIRPIAGSSKSSWLRTWEPDDGRWVEAKLSADGRSVPQSLEPRGTDGSARIELAHDDG